MTAVARKFHGDASFEMIHKYVDSTVLGARQVRAVISDETPDRVGDVIVATGIKLENYRNNPIVLWNHDPMCPIGTASVFAKGSRVEAVITFVAEGVSKIADEVYQLVKAGVVSGLSIGYSSGIFEFLANGVKYLTSELLEISFVSVPCNPQALVTEKSFIKGNQARGYAAPLTHEYESPLSILGGLMRCAIDKGSGVGVDKYGALESATKAYRGPSHPVVRAYAKALSMDIGTAGGFIVPPEFIQAIIPRLYQRAVVRKAGAASVPMPKATIGWPTVVSGSTTYWVGSHAGPLPLTQPGFGQLNAQTHKLAALIPVSNDLIRFAVDEFDQQLGEMLIDEVAVAEDISFLRGDGTQNTPSGLKSFAAQANTYTSLNVIVSSGMTPAEIVIDLQAAVNALLLSSTPMVSPGWVMSSSTSTYLMGLQNSEGLFIFKEMSLKGTLFRIPFYQTVNIPTNLNGGSDSEIYLADFDQAICFDGLEFELALAQKGGDWTDANGAHAAFAEDSALVRAICQRDFKMKHNAACAMISSVAYHL
jgi:HK97 family phage major capsid protein/HK97 family phage prohead protease